MVHYELPKLSYHYGDLEPFIDEKTMQIHHQIHHQSYVDGLNNSLLKIGAVSHPKYISSILSDLKSVPLEMRMAVDFFGGGFENHKFFWDVIIPDGGGPPGGKLADSIDVYFDNFENFKKIFSDTATSIQGSGWCWLVFNHTFHKIEIISTPNQTSPWTLQKTPLLALDMWEHAYYLKYQNQKIDYVQEWWNVVNWDFVENRFSEVSG